MAFIKAHGRLLAALLVLVAIAAAGVWYYESVYVPSFPIASGDSPVTWSFTGAYTGNAALTTQAQADMTHLESLLGKGEYDDYDLNLGIALDYEHLGDGQNAYRYYNRSIAIHPKKALAYADLGNLMDQMKAYNTARDAYAKAVAVEPTQLEYHLQRLTFLTQHFATDTALVASAFTDASKVFGDDADVLAIEAQWLTELGRYADAITAWKTARLISPPSHYPAIDAAIARLKAKQ